MTTSTDTAVADSTAADAQRELIRLDRRRRRRNVLRLSAAMLAAFGAVAGVATLLWPYYRITVSLTDSLPQTVYLLHVGQLPKRGEIAGFRPPPNRFYPQHGGFMKVVRGVAGDVVTEQKREFFVNGESVGVAKTHSMNELPLQTGPTGIIPAHRYYVWTPSADSFDSRYADIGWIPDTSVVGTARPLF